MAERRVIESVFADIRTNADVEKARGSASSARALAFALLGAVILLAGGAFWLYTSLTQAKSDNASLVAQLSQLQDGNADYKSLADRREAIGQQRQAIYELIEQQRTQAWKPQLREAAAVAWRAQFHPVPAGQQPPTSTEELSLPFPPEPTHWDAQFWGNRGDGAAGRSAVALLDQEHDALIAVQRAVEAKLAQLRNQVPTTPHHCNDPNPVNCPP